MYHLYISRSNNKRYYIIGWLGGTTGSASDQRSEGCGFEAYYSSVYNSVDR